MCSLPRIINEMFSNALNEVIQFVPGSSQQAISNQHSDQQSDQQSARGHQRNSISDGAKQATVGKGTVMIEDESD